MSFCFTPEVAKADTDYYGKISDEEVYFYQNADTNSKLFKLPSTYFVKVDAIENSFYKVTYKDLQGYVKKTDVTLMKGQPNTPYYNANFTNYVEFCLYEKANKSSNIIIQLNEEQQFSYYGSLEGQQMSSQTNIWYYASTVQDGVTYKGYIYSAITDNLPPLSTNTEQFEIVSDDSFLTDATANSTFGELSTGTKILLIISIAVPSVFILYFLIKPSKIMQGTNKKQVEKKQSHKIHHGDYFEFDERDL